MVIHSAGNRAGIETEWIAGIDRSGPTAGGKRGGAGRRGRCGAEAVVQAEATAFADATDAATTAAATRREDGVEGAGVHAESGITAVHDGEGVPGRGRGGEAAGTGV